MASQMFSATKWSGKILQTCNIFTVFSTLQQTEKNGNDKKKHPVVPEISSYCNHQLQQNTVILCSTFYPESSNPCANSGVLSAPRTALIMLNKKVSSNNDSCFLKGVDLKIPPPSTRRTTRHRRQLYTRFRHQLSLADDAGLLPTISCFFLKRFNLPSVVFLLQLQDLYLHPHLLLLQLIQVHRVQITVAQVPRGRRWDCVAGVSGAWGSTFLEGPGER